MHHETADRLKSLKLAMEAEGIEGLLVTSNANQRYLTGLRDFSGLLLVTPDRLWIFTSEMFKGELQDRPAFPSAEVAYPENAWEAVAEVAGRERVRSLGFEPESITCADRERLASAVARVDSGTALKPCDLMVETIRARKSPEELARIVKALRVAEEALGRAIRVLRPGVSEEQFASEIDRSMRLAGSEEPAFRTIVAFGERAALPHARPRRAELKPRDAVVVDLGAVVEGYCSDLTRSYLSPPVDRGLRAVYDAVLNAQEAAMNAIRPGVSCRAPDEAARRVLKESGLASFFVHGVGHGVGLEVHEMPRLSSKAPRGGILEQGMVVTIEPGVYIPGTGGIRLEDMVVVTEDGCEVLTACPKNPELKV